MRVVKVMYFEGESQLQLKHPILPITLILIILAAATIIIGIYWAPIADWVRNSLIFYVVSM
jgi:NADH:ubiquinone oxidoreductase subunit 2 (subunit N)